MTEREIAAGKMEGLVALTAFNSPVYESHGALTDLIRARLGERHGLVFAKPGLANGRIVWTTPAPGPIRSWRTLSPAERAVLDPRRAALGADLAGLAKTLARAGINTREGNLAHVLQSAMEVPSGEHVYAVGDQLVLAFWGFRSPEGAIDPFGAALPPARAVPRRRWSLWALLLMLLAALGLLAWLLRPHPVPPAPPPAPKPTPVQPPPLPPPPPPPKPVPLPPPVTPPPPPPPPPVKPPPVHAALPENRWQKHDLSLLKGCWLLGHSVGSYLTNDAGVVTDRGTTRAERLCFDGAGHGQRTSEKDYTHGNVICRAPLSAGFDAAGHLVTSQPVVFCQGAQRVRWLPDTLTCTRRNDEIADCIATSPVQGTVSLEFRRDH
jgi:hypothetical protein